MIWRTSRILSDDKKRNKDFFRYYLISFSFLFFNSSFNWFVNFFHFFSGLNMQFYLFDSIPYGEISLFDSYCILFYLLFLLSFLRPLLLPWFHEDGMMFVSCYWHVGVKRGKWQLWSEVADSKPRLVPGVGPMSDQGWLCGWVLDLVQPSCAPGPFGHTAPLRRHEEPSGRSRSRFVYDRQANSAFGWFCWHLKWQ